jgi:hypothetical protein
MAALKINGEPGNEAGIEIIQQLAVKLGSWFKNYFASLFALSFSL